MQSSNSIVLAYIESYAAEDIYPFVASLRNAGYEEKVVFFTNDIAPSCDQLLKDYSIQNIPVSRIDLKGQYHFNGLLGQFLRLDSKPLIPDISINQRLSKVLASTHLAHTKIGRLLARFLWHCQSARFLYFEDFLRRHESYERILISDARDVVFQSNPFDLDISNRLMVFEEHPAKPIDQQPNNADWIRKLYGKKVLSELSGLPVICCGVTMGSRNRVQEYLSLMNAHIVSNYSGWGTDQGAHNFLIRKKRTLRTEVFRYGKGPAVHVGIAPRSSIQIDSRGRVVNEDGQPFSIVHQYDRHPDVEALLLDQLNQPEEPDPTLP